MGLIRDMGGSILGAAGSALTRLSDLAKAEMQELAPVPTDKAVDEPKTLFWDPFAIVEQLGYKDRPSSLTYATLKSMVYKMPIIYAIIQTRINQVASFSRVQHDRYQLGFRIKLRDTEKEPTRIERRWMQDMEMLITHTGVTDNPKGRDSFNTFLRKVMWDSLVYDQLCTEIVQNRKGVPCEWYAVDGATIRLADSASTYVDEDKTKAVRYVQIYDGMVIAEYSQDEMIFGVRNPHTDIRLFRYGVAELEILITTVTSLLYGFSYNTKQFTTASAPKGIINFKGTIPERQLQAFRRFWYQLLSGPEGMWKTPITNAEDLQYINMQQTSRDMEFSAWIDFLIKVSASCFSMDPIEVNFQYGNVGQKASLTEASNKEKITESKERGLRPLLVSVSEWMNQGIVHPINEDFELAFVGLDAMTREQLAELNNKRVKTHQTIDELRAEDDLPPLEDGKGECILDPTWMQWAQQKEGGEGGEGGDQDFESMLSQFEGGGEEKGGKPGKPDKPGKPGEAEKPEEAGKPAKGAEPKEVEKSLSREWVVEL